MIKNAAQSPRIGRLANASVFAKCVMLMACATVLVAALLSALNFRTTRLAIDDGIRDLGSAITSSAAAANGAALRFGNAEAVQSALAQIIATSDGAAVGAVALTASGEVVAQAGEVSADRDGSALVDLAADAAASSAVRRSSDGFLLAYPSFASADGTAAVGAIAIRWTPAIARAAASVQQTVNIGLSALVLAGLLAVAGWLLKLLVSRPVTTLADEIVTLSEGRYEREIPFTDRGDEIGTIARNLAALREQLDAAAKGAQDRQRIEAAQERVVETLSDALQTVAGGDLTGHLETPFEAAYEPLRRNFNETVATFVRVIEQMARNADTIRENAEGIARSSEDLSSRTENQAASLEETAAALNMITGNVEASARGAQDVEQVVVDARTRAEQSGTVVNETVEAMAQIEESAKQIARITSVIDEIAFQTNLLALNAGVEAARAGEAGRGFSVVANEVRALAQRSSDAANEIKGLIGESAVAVDRGVDLVARAGSALKAITESVSTISGHVEGITKSTREQSASLAEVNSGVAQLDRVTQQNAAMVSEANQASRALRDEANAMSSSIAAFRLPRDDRGTSNAGGARRTA